MKILLASHSFHPAVGGIEASSLALARGLIELGHDVTVLTRTTDTDEDLSIPVLRAPSVLGVLRAVLTADVVLENNPSMRTAWARLLTRRPAVVLVHTWLRQVNGSVTWREHLKRASMRGQTVVAVSEAVKAHLEMAQAIVIPNSYDDTIFHTGYDVERTKDVVAVGRLVSDKGFDILVRAAAELRDRASPVGVTIIGDGPERSAISSLVAELDMDEHVTLAGPSYGRRLAATLNEHKVMVVPSRWEEPFGIVALEGLAAGCRMVVASGGGLAEAAGPSAMVFERGSVTSLAEQLRDALSTSRRLGAASENHLRDRRPGVVAGQVAVLLSVAVETARSTRARHTRQR